MTSERWREIERLYHSALEREPARRPAYLDQACGPDRALRKEIEELLASEEEARDFIETSALEIAAQDLAAATPELAPGQTVDRYRLIALLGAGGMGMVYTARDLRLERTVALKFILEEFTGDPEALERFRREARALSALNHPNICTIYDTGEADGRTFIAMEYVAGKPLDRLVGRKELSLNETLQYAIEIAGGLAKAHSAGIVHRDLKPANIMISDERHVKLLDFGLAKLTGPSGDDSATATTIKPGEAPRTVEGTIVGTVAYMSPEQAQGLKVDARSDIFSFGAVLYEMIAGRRAFAGETNLATLTAILHSEPVPIGQTSDGVPPELDRIVARCLRKDPERRFQNAADLKVALQEIKEESESGQLAVGFPPPRRRSRLLLLAGIAGACAIAAALAFWLESRTTPISSPRLILTRLTWDSGLTTDSAISPDGKLVAFASDRSGADHLDIWVRQIAGGQPIRLTNNGVDNTEPDFSPDSSRIVFCSQRDGGGIYVISALGGEERLIAPAGRRPRFSPDGKWIAYSVGGSMRAGKIYIVASTGGPPRELKMQIPWAGGPVWSPDGKYLLFAGSTEPSPTRFLDWWVAPMEGGQAISTGALPNIDRNGLARSILNPFIAILPAIPAVWTENHIIFLGTLGDATNLWRVAITPKTWRIDTPPERLTAGAEQEWGVSRAADGRLVFVTLEQHLDLWTLAMDTNRAMVLGKPQQLTPSGSDSLRPSLSADGRKLVFVSIQTGNSDIWLRDMTTGKETALTATPWNESRPAISADGSKVAYLSLEEKSSPIYVMSLKKGVGEKFCNDCGAPMGWSPDGKRLLYYWGSPIRWSSIDEVTRQRVDMIRHQKYNFHMVKISPDGNWVVFHTPLAAEDGRSPIFVAPLRSGRAADESEWIQVTDGTGQDAGPWWSPDGGILYFLSQRDGFECIWAQHLDRTTRRPAGPPFAVAHFHSARYKIQEAGFGPGVSRDLLVFTLQNSTGNIWSAKMEVRK